MSSEKSYSFSFVFSLSAFVTDSILGHDTVKKMRQSISGLKANVDFDFFCLIAK